jgi:hypothetical protein
MPNPTVSAILASPCTLPLLATPPGLHENFDILQMVNRRPTCAAAALLANKRRQREQSQALAGDSLVLVLLIKPCASARWRPKCRLVAAGL